jgi:hypothetical protein
VRRYKRREAVGDGKRQFNKIGVRKLPARLFGGEAAGASALKPPILGRCGAFFDDFSEGRNPLGGTILTSIFFIFHQDSGQNFGGLQTNFFSSVPIEISYLLAEFLLLSNFFSPVGQF